MDNEVAGRPRPSSPVGVPLRRDLRPTGRDGIGPGKSRGPLSRELTKIPLYLFQKIMKLMKRAGNCTQVDDGSGKQTFFPLQGEMVDFMVRIFRLMGLPKTIGSIHGSRVCALPARSRCRWTISPSRRESVWGLRVRICGPESVPGDPSGLPPERVPRVLPGGYCRRSMKFPSDEKAKTTAKRVDVYDWIHSLRGVIVQGR